MDKICGTINWGGETLDTTENGDNTNIETTSVTNPITIQKNQNNTGFSFSYNNDVTYLETVKQNVKDSISDSDVDFNNVELAVFGTLMDNGGELDKYTEEELKCFVPFLKAEAATRNLDLRQNSEKFGGSTEYIAENYVPQKLENLGEDEIPGTILVQRTNTKDKVPVILEYRTESAFNEALSKANESDEFKNYFTINNEGKIVFAKWNHTFIDIVEGAYPENLDESEKLIEQDTYEIDTEEIDYNKYIEEQGLKMPFEFLNQLLIITQDPEFCLELVNYVLNSKMIINIQEEEMVVETNETRNYLVHSKDEKYLDYEVDIVQEQQVIKDLENGKNVENETNYLNYVKDDEGNNCTNYDTPKNEFVKIYKKYTTNTYVFNIAEADTWISHFIRTPNFGDAEIQKSDKVPMSDEGEYRLIEEDIQLITDAESIKADKDVKKFISEKKTKYEPKVLIPQTVVIEDGATGKVVNVKYTNGYKKEYAEFKTDENGYVTPTIVSVLPLYDNGKTKEEIGTNKYSFALATTRDSYYLNSSINTIVDCTVSRLKIKPFEKIQLLDTSFYEMTISKYPADPNPQKEIHIYAKDIDGNYEKFLAAYDKSSKAQKYLNSIKSWLNEMMENREETSKLIANFESLLSFYDGQEGVLDELESSLINNIDGSLNAGMYKFGVVIFGDTIQEKIWFALKGLGYSDISIAAAMANIDFMSEDLNTSAVNGEGIGLINWTNERRQALEAYAESKGVTWEDENTQIEFLVAEITGQGAAKKYAEQIEAGLISDEGTMSTHDNWKNAETIEDATLHFMRFFESPEEKTTLEERVKLAEDYHKKYEGLEIKGGEYEKVDSKDIRGNFISGINGRTYTVFNQPGLRDSDVNKYWRDKCNRLAAASIASGYYYGNYWDVLNAVRSGGSNILSDPTSTKNFFNQFGLQADIGYGNSRYSTAAIETALLRGQYVAIHFHGLTHGKSEHKYSSAGSMHWIAIIGYRIENGNKQIFISDSGNRVNVRWCDLNEFDVCKDRIDYFVVVSEKSEE